jgi:DNA (cytosine-5)-methyltransferase 1
MLIEEGIEWHSPKQTTALLGMMSPLHLKKVLAAKSSGSLVVGTLYKRTRPDEDGIRRQRAEVRFDDVAGCLRTPGGGSSRQSILVVEKGRTRSRLLSAREAARLMGLPDEYVLPNRYNDAYHLMGDGVAVPVVKHISSNILEPVLSEFADSAPACRVNSSQFNEELGWRQISNSEKMRLGVSSKTSASMCFAT